MALAAVLAALVLLSMVVAVNGQRALLAVRQGRLDLARVDLAAAQAAAQAAALAAPADSAHVAAILPGAVLATGTEIAGSARATWTILGAVAPFVTVVVEATAPVAAGAARASWRLLAAARRDSLGGARWAPVGAAGWTRVPSP